MVEDADIRQRQVFRDLRARAGGLTPEEAKDIILRGFSRPGATASEKKLAAAFGPLWAALKEGGSGDEIIALIPEGKELFRFGPAGAAGSELRPDEVRRSRWLNNSIYIAKATTLRYALDRLDRDNAQKEEYLSGIVGVLAAAPDRFTIKALRVERPDAILGYNNPADLLAVETVLHEGRKGAQTFHLPEDESFRPLRDWLALFGASEKAGPLEPALGRELKAIYGDDPEMITERRSAFRELLAAAARILDPDARVLIVRSPGRLNVMGRHIDHQGGNCNLMTIGYETLIAVQPRTDDRVRLVNVDSDRFPHREFSIGELVAALPWDDWLSLVNSDKVREMVREARRRLVPVRQGGGAPPAEEILPPARCAAWTSSSPATSRWPPG